jgi:hypothetical protein
MLRHVNESLEPGQILCNNVSTENKGQIKDYTHLFNSCAKTVGTSTSYGGYTVCDVCDNVVRYEKYTRNASRNFQIRPDRCYITWVAISGQQ